MELAVESRSQARIDTFEGLCNFYARELKIDHMDFFLAVRSRKNLDAQACVAEILPRVLVMEVDTSLTGERLVTAVAHEMIHVKQIVRGQLKKQVSKRGKVTWYWLGKLCNKKYYNQPWEIEAYSRQNLLSNRVFERLSNNKPKRKPK